MLNVYKLYDQSYQPPGVFRWRVDMDKPQQSTSVRYSSVGSIACGIQADWKRDSSNCLQGGSAHNPVEEGNLGDCRHKAC
jgi:hypothetical protein